VWIGFIWLREEISGLGCINTVRKVHKRGNLWVNLAIAFSGRALLQLLMICTSTNVDFS
jgi:hypothetical protein